MEQAITTASGVLEVTVNHGGDSTIVRVSGRIDIDSSPDLRDRLIALLHAQPSTIISVDLAQVPYIDTSGIATLIQALKIARHSKSTLCLQGLTGSVLHLFQVTGVLALFEAVGCAHGAPTSKAS